MFKYQKRLLFKESNENHLTVHNPRHYIYINYSRYCCSLFCRGGKIAFSILSNTCMGLGINTIALLEIRGEGVQWNNFTDDISLDDNFHLGYVFFMLILDSIVYMLIAW